MSSDIFFQNQLFQKILLGIQPECQIVQVRPDRMSSEFFFQNQLFQKILLRIQPECQIVWIQDFYLALLAV